MSIAFYPGSFDPETYGHVDITTRASCIFDRVVVGVFDTPAKSLLFSAAERVELFRKAVEDLPGVEVTSYSDLTVEVAREIGAHVMVRGLRLGSDFEYEFQMALMNRKLAPEIDVVCLMTSLDHLYVSSSLLKDIARLGGELQDFVPKHVAVALRDRLRSTVS